MDALILAFSTVFPMLAYMLVGMGVRKAGIMKEGSLKEANALIFKILLPLSLFINVYKSNLGGPETAPVLLFGAAAILVAAGLAWLVYSRVEPRRDRRGVLIQNAFRSNFVLFGLPLSQLLMQGRPGAGLTEILIALIVPLFNVLAVFFLQYYGEEKADFKSVLLGIIKNPLILGAFAGVVVKVSGITLPGFVLTPIRGLASAASPLALLILGAQFNFGRSRAFARELAMGVCSRLLITPALVLTAAVALGFRGESLIAFISMSASPVAVASFTMAEQMNADYELAGQLVVYTSLLSSVTLFFIIAILSHFALL